MPEKVVKETMTGREIVGRIPVPFFVVETLPGEYWLFREDDGCCALDTPFQYHLRRGEIDLSSARYFRRLEKLDGPVSALKTELGKNESIDAIVEIGGRERRFNYEGTFEPQR